MSGVKKRRMQIHTHPGFVDEKTEKVAFLPSPDDLNMVKSNSGPYHVINSHGITLQIGEKVEEEDVLVEPKRDKSRYGYSLPDGSQLYTDYMDYYGLMEGKLAKQLGSFQKTNALVARCVTGGSPFVLEIEQDKSLAPKFQRIIKRSFLCLPRRDFENLSADFALRLLMGNASQKEVDGLLQNHGLKAMQVGIESAR